MLKQRDQTIITAHCKSYLAHTQVFLFSTSFLCKYQRMCENKTKYNFPIGNRSAGLTIVANVAITTGHAFLGTRGPLRLTCSLLYARVNIRI